LTTPHIPERSPADSGLWPALLAHAPQMNFFRFCELIELLAPLRQPLGTSDTPADEPVRFRSHGQVGFPGREIQAVEHEPEAPDLPPVVRTTFLGLYGVNARMPSYFIDEIAQRRDGAEPLAAFLDLFHHRVVTQFYRVARKYRYPMGFRTGAQDEVSRYLLSLVGLGLREAGTAPTMLEEAVGPRKLLSMLGLAGQRTRTAEGLTGVLRHAVPDGQIRVEEFHPVWVRSDPTARMALGENCVLGHGFYDRSNAVRIVITPDSPEAVIGLMPGHAIHGEVMALLRFYLGHAALAHVEMHVRPALMPPPQLNSDQVRLGYTTHFPPQPAIEASKAHALTRVRLGIWNGHDLASPGAC